jgi:heme exporter protein D
MSDWLAMGGYGFYVWSSYGALALAIAIELWLLRRRRAQAHERVRQSIEEETA